MKPSVLKIANAIAYTKTQLMKFGTVVNVWTNRLNFVLFTSERKIAKNIGTQLVKIPSPLSASVFFNTFNRRPTYVGFCNKTLNHLSPTKLSGPISPPAE